MNTANKTQADGSFNWRANWIALAMSATFFVLFGYFLLDRWSRSSDYATVVYPILIWSRVFIGVFGITVVPFVILSAMSRRPMGVEVTNRTRAIAMFFLVFSVPLWCSQSVISPMVEGFKHHETVTVDGDTYKLAQQTIRRCLSDGTPCYQLMLYECNVGGLLCNQVWISERDAFIQASYRLASAAQASLTVEDGVIAIITEGDIVHEYRAQT